MKKGFYHGDTPSGLARKITANLGDSEILLIPVAQTRYFRKLPHLPGTRPVPCILEPSDWLLDRDAAVCSLPSAKKGVDYQ